jgi:hypothetical protein
MSEQEQRPQAEFGGPEDQIRWIADTCHFLVFRPDQPWEKREQLLLPDPEGDHVNAQFRLDGKLVIIRALKEERNDPEVASVRVVDKPEKDQEGDWFAMQTAYNVNFPKDPQETPALEVEQSNTYELFGIILPEYYEAIKEEYETQSKVRAQAIEGLGVGESMHAFQALKQMLITISEPIGVEMVRKGELVDINDIAAVFDAVLDRVEEGLEQYEEGEGRESMRQLVQKAIKELKQEMKNRTEARALGLNVVGDEERAVLMGKLKRLRSNPDAHEITDFPTIELD